MNTVNDPDMYAIPPQLPEFALPILGGAIIAGTLLEDFLTGGLGVVDDPATIALGGSLIFGSR